MSATTNEIPILLQMLNIALPLFLLGVLSPGPATLAIMTISAKSGRKQGVAFALGVSAGSYFWGTTAALGLSSVLTVFADITLYLRFAGGAYLLWLGYRSIRSCLIYKKLRSAEVRSSKKISTLFFSGLMLHLLNPKAILVWLAVISVSTTRVTEAGPYLSQAVVTVCWLFSLLVFIGYALFFSSKPVLSLYLRSTRLIDGLTGVLFTAAGIKLITGR